MPEPDALLIASFLDSIWAENGLARQSLAGYRRDLEGLARWRNGAGGLAAADRSGLFDYLASRTRQGYAARSNARLLSSLRAFYAWLLRRGDRRDDPTALLDPPKLPRSLPKALSEAQIEALLEAPPLDTPLGLRDRAMFELMYAAGLRVSELVGLPANAVNLRQGVCRPRKAARSVVPLARTQHWLERYLAGPPQLPEGAARQPFIGASREAPSRQ